MQKFKLIDDRAFWWPVRVSLPDSDKPGTFAEQSFEMEFETLTQSEAEEIDRLQQESGSNPVEAQNALLRRVCRDWRNVEDENDNPLPFSSDNLSRALDQSWFRAGVYVAYAQALSGEKARLGN